MMAELSLTLKCGQRIIPIKLTILRHSIAQKRIYSPTGMNFCLFLLIILLLTMIILTYAEIAKSKPWAATDRDTCIGGMDLRMCRQEV